MPDVSLADLADLPMILPGLPHGLRQLIDQQIAQYGVSLQVFRDMDSLVHMGRLIANGHGYSILPLSVIMEELHQGAVSVARIHAGALTRSLALVRNGGAVVTHASVRCEDVVFEVLGKMILEGEWQATLTEQA